MNLVEWLLRLMVGVGSQWVMWLMIGLSIISVAVMLERAWFYWSLRDDIGKLAQELRKLLREEDLEGAQRRLEASPSAEAAVVVAGLMEADRGPKAAEEAMKGAAALQRMKLERRLIYLATLGNNAPFIGLFGTVIGIVAAFHVLSAGAETGVEAASAAASAAAPVAVMEKLAEALVATAVGIGVAIPAVFTYNYFQRTAKKIVANTEALSRVLLSHLVAEYDEETGAEAE